MNENLLTSIEMYLETEELRKLGLSEEEIEGYFEFYLDSWVDAGSVHDQQS